MGRVVAAHIKNNRAGEEVFRITPERFDAACRRHWDIAPQVKVSIDWDLDHFDAAMRQAEVLVAWDLPTDDLRARAPALKWIHIIGAGIEHLQPFDWLPRGVRLTNNKGVHVEKAGEYGAMAILMLNNAVPALVTQQREARYAPIFSTAVAGKTLLVIGTGHMGCAVAGCAKRFGLRVLGIRRSGRRARHIDTVYPPEALDDLLPKADFVLVTTPVTPETRQLLNRERLDRMKPGAGLINMSRAEIVDYAALAEKLRDGSLAGAVLDVFDPEPLPESSPLWATPNLVMTPHVSSDDKDAYIPRTLDLFFDNLTRYLGGRPLKNRVHTARGY